MFGNEGNDLLAAGLGNDELDGGLGADQLLGGEGNDIYHVDNPLDQVVELLNQGNDTVNTSVTHTLQTEVENLVLTGAAPIQGYGNNSDNMLTGNISNNALFGSWGNDVLEGGKGNDVLVGGPDQDIYKFNRGDGFDIISDNLGQDKIIFGETVKKKDLLFFRDRFGNLVLNYGNPMDQISIRGWMRPQFQIENLELAEGSVLTNMDINAVIDQMTSFCAENGVAMNSINDVRNNEELMGIIAGGW